MNSRQTDASAESSTVGLLLLAAGASRRMGGSKQLLRYEGESLVRRAARAALASACRPVVVVTGARGEAVEGEIADLPLVVVRNAQWEEGMASSIRTGIERLVAGFDTRAVVVTLCDQPQVGARLINDLIAAYDETGAPLVAARYGDTCGVPALFARRLYPALLALSGEGGAREIIRSHRSSLVEISAPEALFDIDTPADYERLRAGVP